MPEITTAEIKEYLSMNQGKEVSLSDIRKEFNILSGTKSFDSVRNILFQLAEQKIVRPAGKRSGTYKVIIPVDPVPVFSIERERRPPFELIFPRDFDTMIEMPFVEDVVIREGDLILISGLSNYGKTTLAMSFCGENIDQHPVLMGNEYTVLISEDKDGKSVKPYYEPAPRFLKRLDDMDWIQWVDEDSHDKFVLLPVRDDYAEHIVKNKINIIDWINIASGEHYMIGTVLEGIKKALGRGIAIVALQKASGAEAGRGGQFTKDFADLELLVDKFGDFGDVLLTIGKVKEAKKSIVGKTYAYSISQGVKITNFREVKKCYQCHGYGSMKGVECTACLGTKYVNC